MSRRAFVGYVATASAAWTVLPSRRIVAGTAANEQLGVALVGVGGRGQWFVNTIPPMENVVAICDVDKRKIVAALARWKTMATKLASSSRSWERRTAESYQRLVDRGVKTFADYRVMLDKMDKQIDAVIIAIPDHTHAVVTAAAMHAGKHVYCEKPLTRTVAESRAIRALQFKCNVATSMGNQGTAARPFRRALELIRQGVIGQIKEVHIWNTAGGADRKQPPRGTMPVPDYLDWNLWQGPIKPRPFHPAWLNRKPWRQYGTGQLGNWASHTANLAFMALEVATLWPRAGAATRQKSNRTIRVEARSSGINRLSFPRWELVTWDIPPRGVLPEIRFTWHNGPNPESQAKLAALMGKHATQHGRTGSAALDFAGALIVGTKGTIHATGHNATFRLLPEDRFRDVATDRPQTVEPSRGHERDWFIACRGGKPAWANFEYASALNEFLMLGNVATQLEGPLVFDPAACRIVNHDVADRLLHPDYRKGWTL